MENKKNNGGLTIIILILVFIIIGLAGYIVYDKYIKPNYEIVKKTDKTTNNKKEEEKSLIKDSSKEIVYNNEKFSYINVPFINIDSEDADNLNKEIEEYINNNGKNGYGDDYYPKYDYYKNGDNVSVLITIVTEGSSRYYKTANINAKTGKRITNTDLLSMKNIKSSEVADKVFSIYSDTAEKNGSLEAYKSLHMAGDEFTSIYDETKYSLKKLSIADFDMYLNDDDELCVIAEVYLIAGPEKNFYSFNLDDNKYEIN